MRPGAGGWQNVLAPDERDRLHDAVLATLADVGLQVGHPCILEALADFGATVDRTKSVARFPQPLVEGFLDRCAKVDWSTRQPKLSVHAGCYYSRWHDPRSDRLEPLTEDLLADYWRVVRAMPGVDGGPIYGCPWGVPAPLEPLLCRLHAWRNGIAPAAILYPLASSQAILDLCEAYAAIDGRDVHDVCKCAVFLISPLKLAAEEAAQLHFWWSRGFRVEFGHMPTAITSAPATLAGLMVVSLAESLAIALLQAALYGTYAWHIVVSSAAADPRSMIRPYGRPEMALANLIGADMARYYGVPVSCHSGLSDAKLPDEEAGCQKTMAALASLMAGADAMIDAGVLAIDEVISPVQMILDVELGHALRRMLEEAVVDEATLALDAIRDVGPGGLFVDHPHTVRRYRKEHWLPEIWSRDMLATWEARGRISAEDRARDRWEVLRRSAPAYSGVTEEDERVLGQVVERAQRALCR